MTLKDKARPRIVRIGCSGPRRERRALSRRDPVRGTGQLSSFVSISITIVLAPQSRTALKPASRSPAPSAGRGMGIVLGQAERESQPAPPHRPQGVDLKRMALARARMHGGVSPVPDVLTSSIGGALAQRVIHRPLPCVPLRGREVREQDTRLQIRGDTRAAAQGVALRPGLTLSSML